TSCDRSDPPSLRAVAASCRAITTSVPTTKRRRRSSSYGAGTKPLSLREQASCMTRIGFDCRIGRGELVCVGELQPLEITSRYRVEIRIRAGDRPRTRVLHPKLERRVPDQPVPHTYGPDQPCFYYPIAREWMPNMAMSTSVVPWLGLWLIHYEGWRA